MVASHWAQIEHRKNTGLEKERRLWGMVHLARFPARESKCSLTSNVSDTLKTWNKPPQLDPKLFSQKINCRIQLNCNRFNKKKNLRNHYYRYRNENLAEMYIIIKKVNEIQTSSS